ncbi:hypothetical protein [Mycobacterium sp. 1245111.1]|uniref:hypothetical protein n=1 Tax=Mycobacterium sp. 1245111.1 TaxID=1834073 RepID=UPI0012EAD8B2|nr:hypothetical protein [Mycobacterium sp. 1245111.1]
MVGSRGAERRGRIPADRQRADVTAGGTPRDIALGDAAGEQAEPYRDRQHRSL